MIYECLVCGEVFKSEEAAWKHGYMVCPICQSEDLILLWNKERPPTRPEDFRLKEAI